MPVILHADGRPLKDAAGNPLRTGQTVTDDTLGDCIVRGTVALDKGEGLDVVFDWLGPKDPSKPKSRGAEHLTAKYASGGGGTTIRTHTGHTTRGAIQLVVPLAEGGGGGAVRLQVLEEG